MFIFKTKNRVEIVSPIKHHTMLAIIPEFTHLCDKSFKLIETKILFLQN